MCGFLGSYIRNREKSLDIHKRYAYNKVKNRSYSSSSSMMSPVTVSTGR